MNKKHQSEDHVFEGDSLVSFITVPCVSKQRSVQLFQSVSRKLGGQRLTACADADVKSANSANLGRSLTHCQSDLLLILKMQSQWFLASKMSS